MDFYNLKKKLSEFSNRVPGSERVEKLFDQLKKAFPAYESETIGFRSPSNKGWPFGSLLLFTVAGLTLMERSPLLSVVLVVISAILLLWEENGYVIWSTLFSFTRCHDLVLKKGGETPHMVFVVNVDSRAEGLWDRFDPEGVGRTSWLNLSLLLASFITVLSYYFPVRFWVYVAVVLDVVLLLQFFDFIYQGLLHRYYPGAVDNGSGILVLQSISDLVNVPHWIVFVDGGNAGGAGIVAFKKHYKLPKNVLYVALEKPGLGKVGVAQRHGLWSAVSLPKEVKAFLSKEANITEFVDYSYRRSLAAYLNFRGCAAFSVVGQPTSKEESKLLLIDTVDCIKDENIQEAGSILLRLVNMFERPSEQEQPKSE